MKTTFTESNTSTDGDCCCGMECNGCPIPNILHANFSPSTASTDAGTATFPINLALIFNPSIPGIGPGWESACIEVIPGFFTRFIIECADPDFVLDCGWPGERIADQPTWTCTPLQIVFSLAANTAWLVLSTACGLDDVGVAIVAPAVTITVTP